MNNKYNKVLLAGVAILLIFAPLARGAVKIWSLTPILLIESLLIFLWLWRANNSDGYSFKRTKLDYPILAFTIMAILSFVFSIYKHDSFYALLKLFGYIGIYYLIVNEFGHGMKRYLLWIAIGVGTGLSVYGLMQYFGIFDHSWWAVENFLSATYVNHNHFAGYLELVIPVAVGMLFDLRRENQNSKLILIPALITMMAAFILSQSRGAWVSLSAAFLMVIGLLVMQKGKERRKTFKGQNIFPVLLFIIIVFSILYFSKDVIIQRMDTVAQIAEGQEASADTRFKIWRGTLDMIRANPLTGVGIGDFIWAFPRYRPEGLNVQANFAHNDYLQTAAEMGVIALAVMIWLLGTIIIKGMKRSYGNPVKIGCVVGIISLSLHGLVDFNFHIPANMLLFVIYAAIVLSTSCTGPGGSEC